MSLFRAPWDSFPALTVQSTDYAVRAHAAYAAAATGDPAAAADLVASFFQPELIPAGIEGIDYVVPILRSGAAHAIPSALAAVLATHLRARVCATIQENSHYPESAPSSLARLVNQPVFAGSPPKGRCLLVSAHVAYGSAIANLRGYLSQHGCQVVHAHALSADFTATRLVPDPFTIRAIRARFGSEIPLLVSALGFEPEYLTNREALFVYSLSSLAHLSDPARPATVSFKPAG
jgi:hypothetical protein